MLLDVGHELAKRVELVLRHRQHRPAALGANSEHRRERSILVLLVVDEELSRRLAWERAELQCVQRSSRGYRQLLGLKIL